MKVIKYFHDSDEEQITITDLCNKMAEFPGGGTPYGEVYEDET